MSPDSQGQPDVELIGVSKRYGTTLAVEKLNLAVGRGEFFALLGPSGCGKTTTLRMIAGFVQPDHGDVLIRGARVNEQRPYSRDMAMVFQNHALFPHMTVGQNIEFGLRMRKVSRTDRKVAVARALELVKLDRLQDRYPRQLSGGQQQRVALARALVVRPAVLLLDEPLSALDKGLREAMQVELRTLQREVGITTVFVTHDQEEAMTMSDRIAVMNGGALEQVGTPRDVYDRPESEFVARFLGVSNFLDGEIVGCDDGVAQVRIGDTICAVRSTEQPVGGRVRVVVRPEKLTLSSGAEGLPVRIQSVVFRGPMTHVTLRAGDLQLSAFVQNTGGVSEHLREGGEIRCQWDPAEATLLSLDGQG